MAVRKHETEAAPAVPDDSAVIGVLLRMVSHLAVRQALGQGAASFRQIAVNELGIARNQDIDVIDAWLAAHPGT
jgi:hypothetical protein